MTSIEMRQVHNNNQASIIKYRAKTDLDVGGIKTMGLTFWEQMKISMCEKERYER